MAQATRHMHDPIPYRNVGFWAILVGGCALILVFAAILGPTLRPSPSVATEIGEIAGEIKRAAWRSFLGLPQPEAELQKPDIWAYLAFAAPILGVVALVLSAISGVRRENWHYPVYGTGLGAAALLFHFVWWVAMLIAGIMLLVAILENIGDIFSF